MSKSGRIDKPANTLRLLHTSDWHIGKRLHNEARYDDFAQFLAWLLATLHEQRIDILIVAGDIFDTMTPSNKAQELYYDFLAKAIKTTCRHIVIVAGNHDSPSFLDAPKNLLKHFCVHIIGAASHHLCDELLVLKDPNGTPECIVACVPYLRDKDVRTSHFGESLQQKNHNARLGIKKHYQELGALCQATQHDIFATHQKHIPIVATGHLFATGASVSSSDDGMRDLYVGSLGAIEADSFGDVFDYVALGHIHKAQTVGGHTHIRYSGSPMAMGFGECHQQKCVLLVDFAIHQDKPAIHPLAVPNFRRLERICGDWAVIEQTLDTLITEQKDNPDKLAMWLSIEYTGKPNAHLSQLIDDKLKDTPIFVLNIKNQSQRPALAPTTDKPLTTLKPSDVFAQLLTSKAIDGDDGVALQHAHDLLLQQLHEQDKFAQ